jgi:hypothetical protein
MKIFNSRTFPTLTKFEVEDSIESSGHDHCVIIQEMLWAHENS